MRRSDPYAGGRPAISAFAIAAMIVGASASSASASSASASSAFGGDSPADEILAPPPTYEAGGVTVNEQLGARVPADARFRTEDGTLTTLGNVLRGELPTILTFNYSDCPMLCSLQLNGLTAALPGVTEPGPAPAGAERAGSVVREGFPRRKDPTIARSAADRGSPGGSVAFRIGEQFRIVTIGLEPNESVDRLVKMRERYLARLPEGQRTAARAGWTVLAAEAPGETAAIRRVADAVGFAYVFIKDRAEWAHPAALIFLSTSGAVTRYVYGIEFDPQILRESIFKAGLAEPQTAIGFMNRCYHYDPAAKDHSRAGMMVLRVAAAGFVVLFFGGFGFFLLRRGSLSRARMRGRAPTSGRPDLS